MMNSSVSRLGMRLHNLKPVMNLSTLQTRRALATSTVLAQRLTQRKQTTPTETPVMNPVAAPQAIPQLRAVHSTPKAREAAIAPAATADLGIENATETVAVPDYVEDNYWWAYRHPMALEFWDHLWMVNLILYGKYNFLRTKAVEELAAGYADGVIKGRNLQISCAYGDITNQTVARMADDARLDIIDVLEGQIGRMKSKLVIKDDPRVVARLADSTRLRCFQNDSFDNVLSFFLMHEQPRDAREATIREAIRVCKPGGKIVLVDFHKPDPTNLRRFCAYVIFGLAEPYAMDMFRHDFREFLPNGGKDLKKVEITPYVGGMFQKVVLEK